MPDAQDNQKMSKRNLPQSATNSLVLELAAEEEVKRRMETLNNETHHATAVFFDLVESTSYRRAHGALAGLKKAYLHNLIVSQCVTHEHGHVVKWTGDGVLAVFYGNAQDRNHTFRGVRAALSAIRNLNEHNVGLGDAWQEKIHTHIGISAGLAHFLTVHLHNIMSSPNEDQSIGQVISLFDPIGKSVDLASRLQSLACKDAILVDYNTFFDYQEDGVQWSASTTRKEDVEWYDVELIGDRDTVYHPRAAIFQFGEKGVELSTDCMKKYGDTKRILEKAVCDECFFVTEPIQSNVRSVDGPVNIVAVTLECMSSPVKEEPYDLPLHETLNEELKRAEQAYRMGREHEAVGGFERVREKSPHNFHSNLRLAQYHRRHGNSGEARKRINDAKRSGPKHPLLWTLAGTTYFELYLVNTARTGHTEASASLTRAVRDLKRARHLAQGAFDCFLEQYCTSLLGICYFIRAKENKNSEDWKHGIDIQTEIELWPAFNRTTEVLITMMNVFACVAMSRERTPNDIAEARKALDTANEYLNDGRTTTSTAHEDRREAFIRPKFLDTLVTLGTLRLQQTEFPPDDSL